MRSFMNIMLNIKSNITYFIFVINLSQSGDTESMVAVKSRDVAKVAKVTVPRDG